MTLLFSAQQNVARLLKETQEAVVKYNAHKQEMELSLAEYYRVKQHLDAATCYLFNLQSRCPMPATKVSTLQERFWQRITHYISHEFGHHFPCQQHHYLEGVSIKPCHDSNRKQCTDCIRLPLHDYCTGCASVKELRAMELTHYSNAIWSEIRFIECRPGSGNNIRMTTSGRLSIYKICCTCVRKLSELIQASNKPRLQLMQLLHFLVNHTNDAWNAVDIVCGYIFMLPEKSCLRCIAF